MDRIPDYPRGPTWIFPFEKTALLSAEGMRILVDNNVEIDTLCRNTLIEMNGVFGAKNIFHSASAQTMIFTFTQQLETLEYDDRERLVEICDELVLLMKHIHLAVQSVVGEFVRDVLNQAENLEVVYMADARAAVGNNETTELEKENNEAVGRLIFDIRNEILKMSPSADSALHLANSIKRNMRKLHEKVKHKEFDLSMAANTIEAYENLIFKLGNAIT